MSSVTLSGVAKSYGATAVLRSLTLTVPQASVTAVLGPSGCGKTTMLRLIAGFERPDGGTIRFGSLTVAGTGQWVPARARHVGYVPQEGALFPHLTVAENVGFGLPRAQRRGSRRVDELLALVGLAVDVRGRRPHELSGGQQQRVALARALAPSPVVVLLDEPFASLDAGLREGTGRAVVDALREASATAILVTHDQDEALSLADRVAVMREGRIVQTGPPAEVYEAPVDLGVARFVGAVVVLPGRLQEGTAGARAAQTVLGPVPVRWARDGAGHAGTSGSGGVVGGGAWAAGHPPLVRAGTAVDVVVRPEQIRVATAPDAPTAPGGAGGSATAAATAAPPGRGAPGTIRSIRYYGHGCAVHVDLDDGTPVVARVLGPPHGAGPGSRVHVTVAGGGTVFVTA